MKFNLNDTIRVTLTDVGRHLIEVHNTGEAAWFAAHVPTLVYQGIRIDEKGRVSGQAWKLLPILATSLRMGSEPCLMDIEIAPFDVPPCPACGGSRVIDAPIEYDVSGFPCSGPRPCETCRPDDVPSPEDHANG